jgi:hypothetical protein
MKMIVATAGVLAFALSLTSAAFGGNFCANFGSAQIVASGLSIPGKGTCKAFNGFISNEPGLLLAGDVCKSSDGTTILFNTFTQLGTTYTLAGTWAASSGIGSGNQCSPSACVPFDVTVAKCPKTIVLPTVTTRSVEGSPSITGGLSRN